MLVSASQLVQNAPYRVIGAPHWKSIKRDVAGWGIGDHLQRYGHRQSILCVEGIFPLQRSSQYRSIGINVSHGTIFDLVLTIK